MYLMFALLDSLTYHYDIFFFLKETRDYIFHLQLKKIAPELFRLFDLKCFPVGCDLSCPAYPSLLTTPFLFIIAVNTSQHFKLSITGD